MGVKIEIKKYLITGKIPRHSFKHIIEYFNTGYESPNLLMACEHFSFTYDQLRIFKLSGFNSKYVARELLVRGTPQQTI